MGSYSIMAFSSVENEAGADFLDWLELDDGRRHDSLSSLRWDKEVDCPHKRCGARTRVGRRSIDWASDY